MSTRTSTHRRSRLKEHIEWATNSRSFDIAVGLVLGVAGTALFYYGWLALHYFLRRR